MLHNPSHWQTQSSSLPRASQALYKVWHQLDTRGRFGRKILKHTKIIFPNYSEAVSAICVKLCMYHLCHPTTTNYEYICDAYIGSDVISLNISVPLTQTLTTTITPTLELLHTVEKYAEPFQAEIFQTWWNVFQSLSSSQSETCIVQLGLQVLCVRPWKLIRESLWFTWTAAGDPEWCSNRTCLSPSGAWWCSDVPGPCGLLGSGPDPLHEHWDQECEFQWSGTLHPEKPQRQGGVCN